MAYGDGFQFSNSRLTFTTCQRVLLLFLVHSVFYILYYSRLLASRAKAAESLLQGSDVHNLKVNVIENLVGTSSVWLGGSILASSGDFLDSCITKSQYEEEGPRIFRRNVVFNG